MHVEVIGLSPDQQGLRSMVFAFIHGELICCGSFDLSVGSVMGIEDLFCTSRLLSLLVFASP